MGLDKLVIEIVGQVDPCVVDDFKYEKHSK